MSKAMNIPATEPETLAIVIRYVFNSRTKTQEKKASVAANSVIVAQFIIPLEERK